MLATSEAQTDGTQKTQIVDGSGNVVPSGDTAGRAGFTKITDGTDTADVTAAGELKTDLGTKIAGEDLPSNRLRTEQVYSSDYTTGTTAGKNILTGVGYIKGILIGAPAATSVVTVYDNTAASGTIICKLTLAAGLPFYLPIERLIAIGIELVVATASADVTIFYRT